jgi:bacterioferritin
MNNYKKINIKSDISEMFLSDLELESHAIKDLKLAIKICNEEDDTGSKDLLEKILISEEEHFGFLETQLNLIKSVGIENYLTTQI